jgi:hypothetical protein
MKKEFGYTIVEIKGQIVIVTTSGSYKAEMGN